MEIEVHGSDDTPTLKVGEGALTGQVQEDGTLFAVKEITRDMGCVSRKSIKTCGNNILWLSDQGVHKLTLGDTTITLHLTPGHQEALAQLLYGVEQRKGFILLTGEVGTGKTTLAKAILGIWPSARGEIRIERLELMWVPVPG